MQPLNNPKTKKIFLITLGVILVIISVLTIISFLFKKSTNPPPSPSLTHSSEEPIIIPLEYLSPTELDVLGIDPTVQAQIISRDPLIYKIIKSKEDIVIDARPLMQPLRE